MGEREREREREKLGQINLYLYKKIYDTINNMIKIPRFIFHEYQTTNATIITEILSLSLSLSLSLTHVSPVY